jgi:hypothetical protein
MGEFEIDLQRNAGAEPDAPVGIAVRSRETVFTRLIRQGANAPEDHLHAPPGPLAFWLVDNWWRLRWECVPPASPTAEWRLAHDLAGIGGGYAWPRLAMWGEGDRIGLSSRRDAVGVVGPVRYLTDALIYISAAAFEAEVDRLFDDISSERVRLISDWAALRTQIKALSEERANQDVCAWRRLEAQLGYDVDEAPDALMESLSAFQREYGAGAIAEAAMAAQGADAAAVLEGELLAAEEHHWQCDLRRTALLVGKLDRERGEPPWRLGERAAEAVLKAVGHEGGPLSNPTLADILNVRPKAFHTIHAEGVRALAYGLRLNTGRRRGEIVALVSRWSVDRRFEFSRALGDAIWSEGERLGPLTRAKSERQKFQRAFAQSLLCPYEALVEYIGHDVSDGAIAAAARHFMVSERLIRSVLVNKRALNRQRLLDVAPLGSGHGFETVEFDEIIEAA